MLAQRRRRWPDIQTTLGQRILFTGEDGPTNKNDTQHIVIFM